MTTAPVAAAALPPYTFRQACRRCRRRAPALVVFDRDCGAKDRAWEVHQEDHWHRDWVRLVRARSEKAAEVAHSVCLAVLRAYEIRDDAVETACKARARTAEASAKACNGARQVTACGGPRTAFENDAQHDAARTAPASNCKTAPFRAPQRSAPGRSKSRFAPPPA